MITGVFGQVCHAGGLGQKARRCTVIRSTSVRPHVELRDDGILECRHVLLAPGTHAIVVIAADNLGNAGDSTRKFGLHATSRSPRNNIGRSCTE